MENVKEKDEAGAGAGQKVWEELAQVRPNGGLFA